MLLTTSSRPCRVRRWRAAGVAALFALAGCASPGSGPSSFGVERSGTFGGTETMPVVDLTNVNPATLNPRQSPGFSGFGGRRINAGALRPGDKIDVKIFDTGEQGLLSSADSKSLQLGTFQIDQAGMVNLPYVGQIKAAGTTPSTLQDRIAAKLKGSSVSPQATVFVSDAGGSGFTVNGAVNSAGRFNLGGQSQRVLDAVALAGGPSSPSGESEVTLIRGNARQTVSMDRLVAEPSQNVYVQPDDQIFVRRKVTSFTAFGAFKSPGEFKFEPGEMTMAQAVARSGGLLDDRANPEKVYLLRYEPADTARTMGAIPASDTRTTDVPVAYLVNMTQTPSFFVMQSIQMKQGDMLYVPNTGSADFGKVFQIFQKVPATAAAPLPE